MGGHACQEHSEEMPLQIVDPRTLPHLQGFGYSYEGHADPQLFVTSYMQVSQEPLA
jgi:hypothetical protein